ncbi:NUDIX domain-containing protein [Bradyrhizobium sp. WSM 1704]|uniref:NUDIX domain-containing protein n=1 Tax=Bradyrhizobium semiaridum TaxID=2821404 RepID=UPI001CE24FB5|nr:NUDIX domain-containing protein [Bradyrhizobium semiaridum]MCA6124407.1 NUDIX domain-containing protein [Bradyrhizobium semiaridum]
MALKSAGVVAFRMRLGSIEVLLVHPGGPFWRNKDLGAWSIPKGEYDSSEEPEDVARREFQEEIGVQLKVPLRSLGEIRQRGGKAVTAFAAEADVDTRTIQSNSFEIEWPPRSGHRQTFPEVDRAEWFDLSWAHRKINPGQRPLLDRLEAMCAAARKR